MSVKNTQIRKVGLLTSNLNSGNMGCNALTYSAIKLLDCIAVRLGQRFEYILFTSDDPKCLLLYPSLDVERIRCVKPVVGVKPYLKCLITRTWKSIAFFLDSFDSCDIFFEISGGDSFSDIYGIQRPKYFNHIHKMAKRRKTPLVFLPQTIGPFYSEAAKKIAHDSLNTAEVVFVRDPTSKKVAEEYVCNSKIRQNIDMAFFMDYTPSPKRNEKLRIGINPSGLLWNGGYTGKNQFDLKCDYRELLKQLIQSIDFDCFEVELIAHVLTGPGYHVEDDYRVCKILNGLFPQCAIAPFFYTPTEAKAYISSFNLVVSSRMHCCIAAYSAGRAVFPLAYSRKFIGLFKEELGYLYCTDLTTDSMEMVANGFKQVIVSIAGIEKTLSDKASELDVYRLRLEDDMSTVCSALLI